MTYNINIFTDFRGNPYIYDTGNLNDGLIEFFDNEYELLHPKDIFGDDFEKNSIYKLELFFKESWDFEYTECELSYSIINKELLSVK